MFTWQATELPATEACEFAGLGDIPRRFPKGLNQHRPFGLIRRVGNEEADLPGPSSAWPASCSRSGPPHVREFRVNALHGRATEAKTERAGCVSADYGLKGNRQACII
jgi:hypothetical protein